MPTKKTAADKTASPATPPAVSDEELLKQKKAEAKTKKAEKKEERVATKTARKLAPSSGAAKKKTAQKRNPLKIHSKKWRAAAEKIDRQKLYPLAEAIDLVKKTSTTKFDASIEVHTRLGINTAKSDQLVRSTVALPHGTGKKLRVVAFVPAEQAAAAKKAGALEAGEDELIAKIAKGWCAFDVAVATPELMKKLGKVAKTLGQKGLMPNPKAGTVTPDFAAAIAEIQKGKIEFRNDSFGILHNIVGKVSFDDAKLLENLRVYFRAVTETKPKTVKSNFIRTIALATSMGPSVRVEVSSILKD